MTGEKETAELSGTAAMIELLGMAISYLTSARGQVDNVLARILLARTATGLKRVPLVAPDCFAAWRRGIALLPNDLELVKTALEAICSSRLPEEFVLLESVGKKRDASAVLTRLCHKRQDAAVHTLLMAGFDELKNSFKDLERNLLLHETAKCSLQSALLDIESRFQALHLYLESELELCVVLQGLAVQAHGSGKLL